MAVIIIFIIIIIVIIIVVVAVAVVVAMVVMVFVNYGDNYDNIKKQIIAIITREATAAVVVVLTCYCLDHHRYRCYLFLIITTYF